MINDSTLKERAVNATNFCHRYIMAQFYQNLCHIFYSSAIFIYIANHRSFKQG